MIYDILPINKYAGNGLNKQFDFDFYIDNENQIEVYFFDEDDLKTKLTLNVDYKINELKNKNGSFITFPIDGSTYSTLAENETIVISLTLPLSQETEYNKSSLLNLEALEYSLDYLTRLIQIISRKLSLCVKVEECSQVTPQELIDDISAKALLVTNALSEITTKKESIDNSYNYISQTDTKFEQLSADVSDMKTTKSNNSLDNLSDMGKKVLNGQWVGFDRISIAENLKSSATSDTSFDLSSYLPQDDYKYEIMLQVLADTGSTSGNVTHLNLGTSEVPAIQVATTITRTSSSARSGGQAILPIGTNRVLTYIHDSGVSGIYYLWLVGYRRIGTNS